MNPEYVNKISFSSHLRNITIAEGIIEQLSEEGLLNEAVFGNIMVALNEALLNAINHGNQGDPTKMVSITFKIEGDVFEMEVKDEGNGFDHENLPDPTAPENIEKVNGRGIFIMSNLSDEIEFEDKGSRLILRFTLNVPELIVA